MDTREFLGMRALDDEQLHWEMDVEPGLSTPADFMYGGCGLAAGIVSMEIASGRPTVWATAQYISFASTGSHLELDVVLAAIGRKTTQARSVARVGDKEILTVNSALGQPTGDFVGTYVEPPRVDRPENCEPRGSFSAQMAESVFDKIETRQALGRSWVEIAEKGPGDEPHHSAIWARMPGHLGMEAGALAVFGDLVSGGVSQVVGRPSHGSSLDNTIRIAELSPTEWVLCDITIQAIAGGYAQGHANLWSEEGRLLATASQSMSARPFAG